MTTDPRARVAKRIRDPQDECHDRVRRIETRLTQMMIGLGISTQAQRPEFRIFRGRGELRAPSRHSSIKELLDNIPNSWEGPVTVFVGDDPLFTIDGAGAFRDERPQI